LALDVLSGAADPEIGKRIFGCINEETYRFALKDHESEPARVLANMYRQAAPENPDVVKLIESASDKGNYEFCTFLKQQLPRQMAGRRAEDISIEELKRKASTVPKMWR
jgi:hypothetical protein